ncbi:NADPH:quinone reductase-like Zn-dependent oxidoreductase [Crenobacter luteus]|uniref:alcohol dehydrogenase catalytic domain-containing protein n=1 Tax=Crenobacter luteus TaxID=1452487 RepID=UPI0010CE5D6B|nr:alcohol dehydrogenase catalytic domain-containing protein [Crenobacter luteus]TCP14770.1 NADPH:quinone reductase-like Zn-dependent oxidoreductase [Crenobacter luteus]
MPVPQPGKGQVVVRVEAAAVNPIDVKRAGGYGQRLLTLRGAGRFPLVLGNDIAGVVEAVGPAVTSWRPGDRVFGLVPTGKNGAYATHVAVDARWLRPFVAGHDAHALAAFPYTFTTLWQSLCKAGISEANARGCEVLVHGASGGLGRLAIQLLRRWGAIVTAICATQNVEVCKSLGATGVWDRKRQPLSGLPQCYDAALNFGAWQDEETLIAALKPGALGMATTVHPLLPNFDKHGWIGGAWRTRRDFQRARTLATAKGARYGWVVFKPEEEALDALHRLLSEGALKLPVGIAVPFANARQAFDHVAWQRPGRALLLPPVVCRR